ncbi:Gm11487 [Phodopus roborovskii]|uniref:Gm11487 protein n=1 Tax=Phodopus roborovskii TaxID=109678 RepID=A0AAU9ZRN5_PHORO|nr:Gm11487 [Phodopus roborovskii]
MQKIWGRKEPQLTSLRNSRGEARMEQSVQQQGPTLSGPSRSRWTDPDIRIFLQEWEVVEAEIGHPGRKIHKKTRALCQRLFHRGLKKSWQSCFDLLVSLQYLHRKLCSERPRTEPLFSPYAEALYRILGHRPQGSYFPVPCWLPSYQSGGPLAPPCSGKLSLCVSASWSWPSRSRWTDPDIRIFLQEWEVVEVEIGHPGRKIHKKTRALCQRLFHRGLKKSWQSCFDLLVSLQYLHRKLCSERPRTEPLFSPYPGPQAPGKPLPRLAWDYGTSLPWGEPQGYPSLMMFREDSLVPIWVPWNPRYPLAIAHLFLAFFPGRHNPSSAVVSF